MFSPLEGFICIHKCKVLLPKSKNRSYYHAAQTRTCRVNKYKVYIIKLKISKFNQYSYLGMLKFTLTCCL